jgi:hypothetical protein
LVRLAGSCGQRWGNHPGSQRIQRLPGHSRSARRSSEPAARPSVGILSPSCAPLAARGRSH